MANIGDVVQYYHGKNDNRFHEGVDVHDAVVTEVLEDSICLAILNADGNPTIPVSNVMHKSHKKRDKAAAYWTEK